MKKLLLGLAFIAGTAFAYENMGDIFISTVNTPINQSAAPLIIIPQPGVGVANCFTKISLSSLGMPANGQTFFILDGLANGTTDYEINYTSAPFVDFWDHGNPLCMTPNTTTYMKISTGSYRLNVTGYMRKGQGE